MTSAVPLMETIGAEQAMLVVEGAPPPLPGEPEPRVGFAVMTPGAFEAIGIRLRSGRLIDPGDQANAPPVALVNEAFARRHFGALEALGRRIGIGRRDDGKPVPTREIVGVVQDVRRSALSERALPTVYLPHAQYPTGANAFIVHGTLRPEELLGRIGRVIREVNPAIPIYREITMAELVGASVRDRTFLLAILAGFALMALGLAAAGLFGLMSWITAARTREIGLRMAFGARRDQVLALVLRRGMGLAASGVALGIAAGVAGTRLLGGMLYQVGAADPVTFGIASAVLLVAAVAASWHPARRAARTDPVEALRSD
jgi:predicted permease